MVLGRIKRILMVLSPLIGYLASVGISYETRSWGWDNPWFSGIDIEMVLAILLWGFVALVTKAIPTLWANLQLAWDDSKYYAKRYGKWIWYGEKE